MVQIDKCMQFHLFVMRWRVPGKTMWKCYVCAKCVECFARTTAPRSKNTALPKMPIIAITLLGNEIGFLIDVGNTRT